MKLPPVKKQLDRFERHSKPSEDVIVRVSGFKDKTIGRYIHGADFWQVNGWSGQPKVDEWWPLPENGTGEQQ